MPDSKSDIGGFLQTGLRVYRPDIDGLRAIAVLGVVTFHLGLNGGGFVGVDVFFVISGYLITQILVEELSSGETAKVILARFYERRIRRILPALVAMCSVTFVAATVWLFPEDLKEFGRSLQSVAAFISNFYFQRKTGYFDGAADEKPLLHTWSLAVEEQFYLLFPLALLLIWNLRGKSAALKASLAVAAASLAYSEFYVRSSPEQAFFSTPARIWELLIGALLALAYDRLPTSRALRESMASVGILLILTAFVIYSPATSFPGTSATLPVFGSALLIAAGAHGQTFASRLLAIRAFVGLGLISYSVYLWHWPLIVFAKYRFAPLLEQHAIPMAALLFSLSLLLGYLSWRYVEQPFRKPKHEARRGNVFTAQVLTIVVMVLAGVTLSRLDGLPDRWPRDVLAILHSDPAGQDVKPVTCRQVADWEQGHIELCNGSGAVASNSHTVLLWGDSHARVFSAALAPHVGHSQTFVRAAIDACPPLMDVRLGGRRRSEYCLNHNRSVIRYLSQSERRVSTAVLVARWPVYSEGTRMPFEDGQPVVLGYGDLDDGRLVVEDQLKATLRALLQHVDTVVLMAPLPEFSHPVAESLARTYAWGHPPLLNETRASVARRQASSIRALEAATSVDPMRVHLISPLSFFCDQQICRHSDGDGQPLFYDTNHLNSAGIAHVAPLVKSVLSSNELRP